MSEIKIAILQTIAAIPKGRVCTYGGIARLAGVPSHARYVGTILKNLPTGSTIPWHRVINGKGELSFPINSDKWLIQKKRLEQEGIEFHSGKIKLKNYTIN